MNWLSHWLAGDHRDPERIDEMLQLLREAWLRDPDIRLGQLICNASRVANGNVDPFNTEDDQILTGLRYLAGKNN